MNIIYIPIDSATPFRIEILEDGTEYFPTSDEYRYLSAFKTDGGYILKCSKDLQTWETCIAAFMGDKLVDHRKVIEIIKQAQEGENEANNSGSDSGVTEG